MKPDRMVMLVVSAVLLCMALAVFATGIIWAVPGAIALILLGAYLANFEGFVIEAPSHVYSGETFKIVVTYNRKPASKAHITFEGAVIEPTRTNDNGVATITAPNVTEPAKVTIHVRYHVPWQGDVHDGIFSPATITVLPTKEVKEKA